VLNTRTAAIHLPILLDARAPWGQECLFRNLADFTRQNRSLPRLIATVRGSLDVRLKLFHFSSEDLIIGIERITFQVRLWTGYRNYAREERVRLGSADCAIAIPFYKLSIRVSLEDVRLFYSAACYVYIYLSLTRQPILPGESLGISPILAIF
jgi:hypothetical protein